MAQQQGVPTLGDLAKIYGFLALLIIAVVSFASDVNGCANSSTKSYNDYKNEYYGSEQYQRTGKSYEQKLRDDEYEQELKEEIKHRLNRDF